jgi:hypothetical protein
LTTWIDTAFWQDISKAIQRVAGAAVLILAHWLLQLLLKRTFADFPQYAKVEYLATVMALIAFVMMPFAVSSSSQTA